MFDPSKMDPKAIAELSRLMQQLPPEKLFKMQSIMHNMMAGFDVRQEMEEFEKDLPSDFRTKILTVFARETYGKSAMSAEADTSESSGAETAPEVTFNPEEMNVRRARLTLLEAVAERKISPEEAEKILFPER